MQLVNSKEMITIVTKRDSKSKSLQHLSVTTSSVFLRFPGKKSGILR
jgi:hypothetical protein